LSIVQQIKSPLVKLNDGNEIPIVGLGTSRITDSQAYITVKEAINSGYRHFDTAYFYNNEKVIGTALKDLIAQNRIKREDVFITSKVWCNFHSRPLVVEGLKISLKNLGLEYLDLALVHYPTGFKEGNDLFPKFRNGSIIPRTWKKDAYLETWKGMEDALKLGLAKSIGVSNFNSVQLKRVLDVAEIKPVVNQVLVLKFFIHVLKFKT
jgi:diketogulonate reductase-like aldo/keto reductase